MFWKKPPQGPKGKEAAPQALLPMHQLDLVLGTHNGQPVRLRHQAAAMHRQVTGISGMGKSKLLVSLAAQILNQRSAFALIDPHGDLADDLLRLLLDQGFFDDPRALARLRYFAFGRTDRFVPWNVLEGPYESTRIGMNVWEGLTRFYVGLGGGNAAMLEGFVKAGAAVLAANHEPLTQLPDLLTKPNYRAALLSDVHDPLLLDFLGRLDENERRASGDVASTLRRFFNLTYSLTLRYTLGQQANNLPLRWFMDQEISQIYDLSSLAADDQRLIGCLLTAFLEDAGLSRADLPEEQRTGVHIIIDEFSQFCAQSAVALERVLSLCRKYGLVLTLAHQSWSQASDLQGALQNACFIAFRLGHEDSHWAASRIADVDLARTKSGPTGRPVFVSAGEQRLEWEQTLMTLQPRQAVLRLGQRTQRFQALGIPAPRSSRQQLAALKEAYAQRYLVSRSDIERTLTSRGPDIQSSHPQGRPGEVVVDADPPAPRQPRSAPSLPSPTLPPRFDTKGTRRARRQIPL